ncbi:MAG TPA: transcription antitermination factor NusB [Bacillota bacterium]|nr:transcription antitermination factor NusB [Bacillota bacterium]
MSRRLARERALQVLFQVDMAGADEDEAFSQMDENFGTLVRHGDFAVRLVRGTLENLGFIDGIIAGISKDWDIKRMAYVDRNIMRLALYEILFCDDIPDSVSVNEAIEMGKTFGGEESGKFINGILGKVLENPDQFRPCRQ